MSSQKHHSTCWLTNGLHQKYQSCKALPIPNQGLLFIKASFNTFSWNCCLCPCSMAIKMELHLVEILHIEWQIAWKTKYICSTIVQDKENFELLCWKTTIYISHSFFVNIDCNLSHRTLVYSRKLLDLLRIFGTFWKTPEFEKLSNKKQRQFLWPSQLIRLQLKL